MSKFIVVRTYPEAYLKKPGVVEDAGEVGGNSVFDLINFVDGKCKDDRGGCGYHIEERKDD